MNWPGAGNTWRGWRWAGPWCLFIDREGDSVGRYRQWTGQNFLVRAKGGQRVQWEGAGCALSWVALQLRQRRDLVFCREGQFHGRKARQYVAETAVVLSRPTRQKRRGKKPRAVAGVPVPLRRIVSEVRALNGRVLAVWWWLSNVEAQIDAGQLALWYYWRWRIESFFKLLKGAGQQIEQWQQQSAVAVAKRLLCRYQWLKPGVNETTPNTFVSKCGSALQKLGCAPLPIVASLLFLRGLLFVSAHRTASNIATMFAGGTSAMRLWTCWNT